MGACQLKHRHKSLKQQIMSAVIGTLLIIFILAGCASFDIADRAPWGHTCMVDEIIYERDDSAVNSGSLLVQIDENRTLLICNDVETNDYLAIGKFETVNAEQKRDPVEREWELFAGENNQDHYRLVLTPEGKLFLSYLKFDELQWKYILRKTDEYDMNMDETTMHNSEFQEATAVTQLRIPEQSEILQNGYPKNEYGETYGPDVKDLDLVPDLLLVQNEAGVMGYIRVADMEANSPKTPTDIEEYENITKLNLYLEDGRTIIGEFYLSTDTMEEFFYE